MIRSKKTTEEAKRMDLLTLISRGVIPVIDFKSMKGDVKPFLAKYGGHINSIGIVVKDETGRGFFQSNVVPPASPDHTKFLSLASDLFHSIGIRVYAIVPAFLDSRAAREPRFRTTNRFGKQNERFACPTNVTNQANLAKLFEELASSKLVDDIVVVDDGYVRRDYCFCDTCQKEFALRAKLPLPIKLETLNSKQGLFDDWIAWRAEVVNGLLDTFTKRVAEASAKAQKEVNFYASVDLDERTKYMQGALQNFGQDVEKMAKLGNVAIRIQPWTPIIPAERTPEHGKMLNDLRSISNYLTDYNRKGVLLVWNIENEEELETTKDMLKASSASAALSFQSFPSTIGAQRDAHLGLDLEAK
jgi:hypothetical protein